MLNEFYLRDFSRKQKAAYQARSRSGIPTTNLAIYGYLETRQKEDAFLRQIEERVEQAIRQAEARGFANAMQMMQVGLMPKADPTPSQTASQPQPDSMQAMEMDEESLNIAMDFIDSL